MAVEMSIQRVRNKLENLKKCNPRLACQVDDLTVILTEVEGFLDKKGGSYGCLDKGILRAIFLAEDTVDSFPWILAKQKHKVVFFYMHLKSYNQTCFINKMGKVVNDLRKESHMLQVQSSEGKESCMLQVQLSQGKESGNMQVQLLESVGNAEQPEFITKGYPHDKKTSITNFEGTVMKLANLILKPYSVPFPLSLADTAGSGKTSELRKIYNSVEVKDHFECCAWVRVGQELDKRQLLTEILKQVSVTSGIRVEVQESLPLDGERQLHDFLFEKRYLIVLLDVRTPDIWETLKNAFPNSLKGSRLIFNFRKVYALRNLDVRFYGREALLNSKDIGTSEQEASDGDLDGRLEGVFGDETDIVGLQDKLLELAKLTLKRISDIKYSLISVVGVSGFGKTTLVKAIYNNPYIRQNFRCRAWVSVHGSQDFDKRKVLIDIWKQVKQDKDGEGLLPDELESKLIDFLSEKKFLIVLDDVHHPDAWDALENILLPRSLSGSRVILITRDNYVARDFSQIIFQLRPLNEDESCALFLKKVMGEDETGKLDWTKLKENDESWALFIKKVMRGDKSHIQELTNVKKKVWQKCHGLPISIGLLGGLLTGRELSFSELPKLIDEVMQGENNKDRVIEEGKREDGSVIENATSEEDHSTSEAFADKMDPSAILSVAFKKLNPTLRACLQHLCLFPRSCKIPVRRLFHLWLAEGIITSEVGGNTLEDQLNQHLGQLKQRSMLELEGSRLNQGPKKCMVPNTVYDTLFKNDEDTAFFHIHPQPDSTSTSQKPCIRWLAEHSDLFQKNSSPDMCVEYLHTYISFNTQKGDKPVVGVGMFLNKIITNRRFRVLRVLDLEHVYKPVLPESLGKLKLLRYIGLRWTFLDKIPKSIGDLPHLETLDVKHTNITKLPMSIWMKMTLRHIYMNEIRFQMSPQKQFSSDSLANLQTLWGLFVGNESINWLKGLTGLRKLGLTCHTKSLGKGTNLISQLSSLEILRLRSVNDFGEPSGLHSEFMQELTILSHLRELHLLGKFPREIDISLLAQNANICQNLIILTLSVSQLSNDPMPKLGELNNLKILRLLANSYIGERMACHKGGFPKLRVLKLWVLKELKEWTIEAGAMPALEELEIRYCQKLKKIKELENVVTLKELVLTNMENDFIQACKKYEHNNLVVTDPKLNVNPPWD